LPSTNIVHHNQNDRSISDSELNISINENNLVFSQEESSGLKPLPTLS
jgi:hypothetical protein